MPLIDKQIYELACVMLDKHGKEAREHALLLAQARVDEQDVRGAENWLKVVDAIDDLQHTDADLDDDDATSKVSGLDAKT